MTCIDEALVQHYTVIFGADALFFLSSAAVVVVEYRAATGNQASEGSPCGRVHAAGYSSMVFARQRRLFSNANTHYTCAAGVRAGRERGRGGGVVQGHGQETARAAQRGLGGQGRRRDAGEEEQRPLAGWPARRNTPPRFFLAWETPFLMACFARVRTGWIAAR